MKKVFAYGFKFSSHILCILGAACGAWYERSSAATVGLCSALVAWVLVAGMAELRADWWREEALKRGGE